MEETRINTIKTNIIYHYAGNNLNNINNKAQGRTVGYIKNYYVIQQTRCVSKIQNYKIHINFQYLVSNFLVNLIYF